MEPYVVRASRGKTALFILASLAFVVIGVLMLNAPPTRRFSVLTLRVTGAAAVLLFGYATVYLVRQLFARMDRIVINDAGILDRSMGVGVIPWSEVRNAFLLVIRKQEMVCLELRDEPSWLAKLPLMRRWSASANRRMGATPFVIGHAATTGNSKETLRVIQDELARRGQAQS